VKGLYGGSLAPGITKNVGKTFLRDPEDRGFISVESRPSSTDTSGYIWILLRSEKLSAYGQAHFVPQWGMREMGNRGDLGADCYPSTLATRLGIVGR
jgi:hypothetical protein